METKNVVEEGHDVLVEKRDVVHVDVSISIF